MVVVGRWRQKGGPHEPHPIFIFQTIFISNLITMIKRELREPVAKFDIIPNFYFIRWQRFVRMCCNQFLLQG